MAAANVLVEHAKREDEVLEPAARVLASIAPQGKALEVLEDLFSRHRSNVVM